jgi:hypothetical protein
MASFNYDSEVVVHDSYLQINNLRITDHEIRNYFSGVKPENLLVEIEKALRLGVTALKAMVTTERIDYIEKSFNSMNTEIQHQLNQAFGEDGRVKMVIDRYFGENGQVRNYIDSKLGENGDFSRIIAEHFGPEGKVINEIFNPDKSNSPLWSLKKEMLDAIEKIRKDLGIKEATDSIKEKTVLKGADFETEIMAALEKIAQNYGDVPDNVSTRPGLLKNSKKGDFVVQLSGSDKKIVLEAKESKYSLAKIIEEMDEAIENRGADYGIFVEKYVEDLPDSVGWFNEYKGRYLVVALKSRDGQNDYDNLANIAYKWARIRALSLDADSNGSFKTLDVKDEMTKIGNSISKFRTIRTYCTNASEAVENIRSEVRNIEKEIKDSLDEVLAKISH